MDRERERERQERGERQERQERQERHGNVGSQVEKKERPEVPKYAVDREATCPLLLRVFCSTSRHNSMSEYSKGDNSSRCELLVFINLIVSGK